MDNQQEPQIINQINPVQQAGANIDGIVTNNVNKVADGIEAGTNQAEQLIETGISAVEGTVNKAVDTLDSALGLFDRLFK